MAINSTSFTKTPQAGDDSYVWTEDQLINYITETNILSLDVMANDLGGNAKKLYSVDDGNGNPLASDAQLLVSDVSNGVSAWELTANGNLVRINNGKIEFDISHSIGLAGGTNLNSLAAGDRIQDYFVYSIRLGNGTLSQAVVRIDITGTNDAPVVSGSVTGTATEDGNTVTLNALAQAGDVDHDTLLSVTDIPGLLPAGVSYNAAAHAFTLDPSDAAYQHLAVGDTTTVSITYSVSDGITTTPASVSWTITGTNDAPVITNTANALVGAVREDAVTTVTGQLSATDVDNGATQIWSVQGSNAGTYGSLTVDSSTGQWTYTLSNDASNVQALAAGESYDEIFTVRVDDGQGGSVDQTVTVTVNGTNDVPTLGGVTTNSVTEDATNPNLSTGGQLTIADVDAGQSSFAEQVGIAGAYGTFTLAVDGAWTYTSNNSQNAIQQLGVNQSITDNFTAVSSDGTASQVVTVTINGTNDIPVITNTVTALTGAVQEDTVTTVTGQLSAADVDNGATQVWSVQGSNTGSYGSLAVDSGSGLWTYTLNNDAANVQALAAGESHNEIFTVRVDDGEGGVVDQTVTVAVNGANDAPVANNDSNALTVTSLANVTHSTFVNWVDWTSAASGSVYGTIDLGNGQTIGVTYTGEYAFTQTNGGTYYYTGPTGLDGTYTGSAVENAPGSSDIIALSRATQKTLTFSEPVNNLFFAVVSLNGNGYLFDQDFQIASDGQGYWGSGYATRNVTADGRYEVVGHGELHGVLQISGTVQSLTWTSETNEYWNGFTVGTYGQAQSATVSGNLLANDSDPDTLDTLVVASVNGSQIVGNSVTLVLASGARVQVNKDGTYLYDENAAFGSLAQDETAYDSFQYTVSDGHGGTSTATVTVAITGTNDVPTIGGVTTGSVTEDTTTPDLTTDGLLTIADVDAGQSSFAEQVGIAGAYGTFTLAANGAWTYTANNSQNAIQQLGAGQSIADSFTAVSSDGSASQVVTVTINGTNDAPVITNVATDLAGTIAELANNAQDENAAVQTVDGVINFTDVDVLDIHSAAIVPQSNDYLGVFTLDPLNESGQSVGWSYSVNDAALDYLAEGQVLTQKYDVTLDDGQGGTTMQTVTITLTGTADSSPPVAVDDTIVEMVVAGDVTLTFDDPNAVYGNYDYYTGGYSYSYQGFQFSGTGGSFFEVYPYYYGTNQSGSAYTYTYSDYYGGEIQRLDGSDFDINSLDVASYYYEDSPVSFVGYRDGVAVASMTALVDPYYYSYSYGYQYSHVEFGSEFSQIDKLVITEGSGGYWGDYIFIDNLQLAESIVGPTEDSPIDIDVLANDSSPDSSAVLSVDQFSATSTLGAAITLNADGTLHYDPTAVAALQGLSAGEVMTDTFTYTTKDQNGQQSNPATVTINVHGVDDKPVAHDISQSATEANPVVTLAANVTDDAHDTHTFSLSGSQFGAAISNNGDGTFTYDPSSTAWFQALAQGQTATDSFNYTVTDNHGGTSTATASITVIGMNDAPVAHNDRLGTPGENFIFNPENGHYYAVTSGWGDWFQASAMAASMGGYLATVTSASENSFIQANLDPYGDWMWLGGSDDASQGTYEGRWIWATGPEAGTVIWEGGPWGYAVDGQYTNWSSYSEPNNWGGENFVHMWGGGTWNDLSASGVMRGIVEIGGRVGDPDQTPAYNEDAEIQIDAATLLANDTDVDAGSVISVSSVSAVSAYGASLTYGSGSIIYDSIDAASLQALAEGEKVTDSFTYTVTDEHGLTSTATVSLVVGGKNDGPVITSQDLIGQITEQASPTGNLSDTGIIAFSDLDLTDIHLISANGAPVGSALGSLTVVQNTDTTGSGLGGQLTWTYTVDDSLVDYLGEGETKVDSFNITIDDQHGGLITEQIDVIIVGVADLPV